MALESVLREALGEAASDDILTKIVSEAKNDAELLLENETKGLKDNQQKLLDQLAKLKKNQLPEGFDMETFKKFQEDQAEYEKKQAELEEKRLADEGQWEALKQQLIEKNQSELQKITEKNQSEITQLRNALDKELIENAAIKAIEKEKGNSFFLLPHMKDKIRTINEDGAFKVQVLDSEGNPRIDDTTGDPFTIHQLVAEMKANDQFAPAFPDMNAGSGNTINVNGKPVPGKNPWKKESFNATEQAKMMKSDPTLAAQMKKAAGVTY
jgi:hypothetical protein